MWEEEDEDDDEDIEEDMEEDIEEVSVPLRTTLPPRPRLSHAPHTKRIGGATVGGGMPGGLPPQRTGATAFGARRRFARSESTALGQAAFKPPSKPLSSASERQANGKGFKPNGKGVKKGASRHCRVG